MKLKTKGRYAVTAMLDVALHQNGSPVSLIDISKRQAISQSYLEQLFAKLKKEGLVKSVRGPGGGYYTQANCNEITVEQIIKAVDSRSLDATSCRGSSNCLNGSACLTHQLWQDLNEVICEFFSKVTLADLIEKLNNNLEN